MLKQNLGWVMGKTEPMEKFGKLNQQKIHISSFPSVDGNGISGSAIMKKLKNGSHFVNIDCTENFQITDPPKVWVSSFPSVDGNRISVSAIMKTLKNGSHFVNMNCTEKFQITNPPKVWVSSFPSVNGNRISASAIVKKLKNGSHFINMNCTNECQWKWNIIRKLEMEMHIFFFSEFSIGSFFPITHPRFHFNIYAWLHLKHLCVVYPTSHLCVVLHFLIFSCVFNFCSCMFRH